jgi:hypothetical protein
MDSSSLESETHDAYRRHLAATEAAAEAEIEEKGQLEAKLGGEKEDVSLTPPLVRRNSGEGQQLPQQHPGQGEVTAEAGSHAKTVTFNSHDTPLVFSRHSSFESLNSFYQHSIRTGQGPMS